MAIVWGYGHGCKLADTTPLQEQALNWPWASPEKRSTIARHWSGLENLFGYICLVYWQSKWFRLCWFIWQYKFIWRMIGSVRVFLNKIDSLSMKVSWTLKDIGLIWSLYGVTNCLGFFGPWCENQPPQIAMSTWGIYIYFVYLHDLYTLDLSHCFFYISPHLHHLLAASSQLLGLVGLTVEGFLGYLVGYIKNTMFLDKLNVFTKG